jgi:hypothetical protein
LVVGFLLFLGIINLDDGNYHSPSQIDQVTALGLEDHFLTAQFRFQDRGAHGVDGIFQLALQCPRANQTEESFFAIVLSTLRDIGIGRTGSFARDAEGATTLG